MDIACLSLVLKQIFTPNDEVTIDMVEHHIIIKSQVLKEKKGHHYCIRF